MNDQVPILQYYRGIFLPLLSLTFKAWGTLQTTTMTFTTRLEIQQGFRKIEQENSYPRTLPPFSVEYDIHIKFSLKIINFTIMSCVKSSKFYPCLVWLIDWASSSKEECCQFNSQLEHMPELWVYAWEGHIVESTNQCFLP